MGSWGSFANVPKGAKPGMAGLNYSQPETHTKPGAQQSPITLNTRGVQSGWEMTPYPFASKRVLTEPG